MERMGLSLLSEIGMGYTLGKMEGVDQRELFGKLPTSWLPSGFADGRHWETES